jgi:glycosyltransferase involved in cell wall biosynthesis
MMNSTVFKDSNIKPLVSVCMITYNHQDYIKQAIEGVLMQDTSFDIELIISNDRSTDNTNEHVQHIIDVNPKGHLISYFEQKENRGMMSNFTFALKQCKAKYIALCEGDDYWTDPLKLQKQVDLLEKSANVNICFHRAQVLRSNELNMHEVPEPFYMEPFDYIELLKHYNFMTTASVLFRKPEGFNFPNWFYNLPFGDMGLYKLVSKGKQIQCLDEVMCVYRVHDKGIYSGLSNFKMHQNYLNFYKVILPLLNAEERTIVTYKIKINGYKMSKLKFPNNRLIQKIYNMYLRHN